MNALLALLALAPLALQAHAQTPAPTPSAAPAAEAPAVPLALQVERLAPQLVAFAGSQANLQSLVGGLAAGAPVTLTTVAPDGITQSVTFTPAGVPVSSPVEIARVLETTRQQLIAAGIAAPSAQQIAVALTGAAGASAATTTTTVPPAAAGAAAGATVASPAQQLQSRSELAPPQVNTSDSRRFGNTSDSPVTAPAARTVPPAPPATVNRAGSLPPPGAVRR